jgi:Uma2 family endonuclease
MVQAQSHTYTPDEYLALEAKADCKSEYRDGAIVPMTGGTTNIKGLISIIPKNNRLLRRC